MKKRVKKVLIIILFFLFVFICINKTQVEAYSVIGFENDEYYTSEYRWNTKVNPNQGIDGSKCVEINLSDYDSGYFSYKFTGLNQLTKYKISAYVKTVDVEKSQNAGEDSGALIYTYIGVEESSSEKLEGTNSYRKVQLFAYPTNGEIEIICALEDSKGIAYFDNIEITEVSSQEIYSTGGNILMKYDNDVVQSIGGKANLQELCNNIQTAYNDLIELLGVAPPTSYMKNSKKVVIIDLTANIDWGAMAFARSDCGYIIADKEEIVKDFAKLKYRKEKGKEDWNFLLLHELGHLFQNNKVWDFEEEGLTDFQLAYILEKENVGAAPSEFDADTFFVGRDIINAFYSMRVDKMYLGAYKLTSIAQDIGWNKFKICYQNINNTYGENGNNYSKIDKFYIYMDEMAKINGEALTNYFTMEDWAQYVRYLGGYQGNTVKLITLSQRSLSLKNNETATITATVTPSSQEKVDWFSSDLSVATVNNGKIKAKKTGNAVISAVSRDNGLMANANLTVTGTAPTVEITSNPSTEIITEETITYTFTWSKEVTGFTEEDITLTNGTRVSFNGQGKVYNLVVKNSGNYTQTVSVAKNKCTDLYGNSNEAAYITKIIQTNNSGYKIGDVTKDGRINIRDIIKIRKYIANSTKWDLTDEQKTKADVDKNNKINIRDIIKIRKYIAASSNESIGTKHPDWLNL